ncbi:hypothetical protein C3L33_13909, partial [Rhododendron williamsianum]
MPIGANVESEQVCLSKKEGGLGLKVLEVEEWDKVTMSRRIGPSAIKLTSFGLEVENMVEVKPIRPPDSWQDHPWAIFARACFGLYIAGVFLSLAVLLGALNHMTFNEVGSAIGGFFIASHP